MTTTTETKPTIATQAGHWYDAVTGAPCYTIIGANGKERATTLRDARKLNLVPSVTTITRILEKPGLANWIAEQLIHASLTLKRNEGESDADYIARIKVMADEKRDKAAERGTALHADIEFFIKGKPHGHEKHIKAILAALAPLGIDLLKGNAERSFAHPSGYGGKIDWSDPTTILDFKSKDKIEEGKKLAWDEHVWQLGAYAEGLGIKSPRCINVFVGIDDELVVIVDHPIEDIAHGQAVFKAILNLWKLKNKVT